MQKIRQFHMVNGVLFDETMDVLIGDQLHYRHLVAKLDVPLPNVPVSKTSHFILTDLLAPLDSNSEMLQE